MVTPATLPTINQTLHDSFISYGWDFQKMLPILIQSYAEKFGTHGVLIVNGILFLTVIGIIWMRQEDAIIPMMIIALTSNVLLFSSFIPPDWEWLVVVLGVLLPLAGIGYTFFHKR